MGEIRKVSMTVAFCLAGACMAGGGCAGYAIANNNYDREAAVQTKLVQLVDTDVLEFEHQVALNRALGVLPENFDFETAKEEYLNQTAEQRLFVAEKAAETSGAAGMAGAAGLGILVGAVTGIIMGSLAGAIIDVKLENKYGEIDDSYDY